MNKFRTKNRESSLIHGISGYSSNKLVISRRQSVFQILLVTFVSSRLFYVSLSNFLFLYCDQTPVASQSKFFDDAVFGGLLQTATNIFYFNFFSFGLWNWKCKNKTSPSRLETAKKMLRSMNFPINQTRNQSIL